ncbi:hypothetical protein [Thalassobaculum sp.]|uniref:hypothetical protein n=1 Tax=Thalassobaculum sp. TaxID=2022740 RepID=UPI0032ED55A8
MGERRQFDVLSREFAHHRQRLQIVRDGPQDQPAENVKEEHSGVYPKELRNLLGAVSPDHMKRPMIPVADRSEPHVHECGKYEGCMKDRRLSVTGQHVFQRPHRRSTLPVRKIPVAAP